MSPADTMRPSATPLSKLSRTELIQISEAMSGSPFSTIEVMAGTVAVCTNSTSQP